MKFPQVNKFSWKCWSFTYYILRYIKGEGVLFATKNKRFENPESLHLHGWITSFHHYIHWFKDPCRIAMLFCIDTLQKKVTITIRLNPIEIKRALIAFITISRLSMYWSMQILIFIRYATSVKSRIQSDWFLSKCVWGLILYEIFFFALRNNAFSIAINNSDTLYLNLFTIIKGRISPVTHAVIDHTD